MEHILSYSSSSEFSILGNFSVDHRLKLSSRLTDPLGEEAFNFAILNNLEQLVQFPSHIPDCLGDQFNIIYIFLANHPSASDAELFPTLGSSDHNLISVFCPIFLIRLLGPPKRRHL